MTHHALKALLCEHLEQWGLKRFTADHEYDAWQKQRLSLVPTCVGLARKLNESNAVILVKKSLFTT